MAFSPAPLPELLRAPPPREASAPPRLSQLVLRLGVATLLAALLVALKWPPHRSYGWWSLVLMIYAIYVAFRVWAYFDSKKTRWLAAHGHATAAEITRSSWGAGDDSDLLHVTYQYEDTDGATHEGVVVWSKGEVRGRGLGVPGVGDTMFVVFDPDRPSRHDTAGFAPAPLE